MPYIPISTVGTPADCAMTEKPILAQRQLDPSFKPTHQIVALQTAKGTWTYKAQTQTLTGPEKDLTLSSTLIEVLHDTVAMDAETLQDINPEVDSHTRQQLEALDLCRNDRGRSPFKDLYRMMVWGGGPIFPGTSFPR